MPLATFCRQFTPYATIELSLFRQFRFLPPLFIFADYAITDFRHIFEGAMLSATLS